MSSTGDICTGKIKPKKDAADSIISSEIQLILAVELVISTSNLMI